MDQRDGGVETDPTRRMILALDLGSARIGYVLAERGLPIRIRKARTIDVDPAHLDGAVKLCLLQLAGVTGVIIEHGRFYARQGWSAQKIMAMQQAWRVADRLQERFVLELELLGFKEKEPGQDPPRLRYAVIPRASWAHRVVPHARGGITTAMANAGLRAHLAPESVGMLDGQDQRDAAGCLVWAFLPPPPRAYRYRDRRAKPRPRLTPEQRLARRRLSWRDSKRRARGPDVVARLEGDTCNCGPEGKPRTGKGRHKATCPIAAGGLSKENVARAAKALDAFFRRA